MAKAADRKRRWRAAYKKGGDASLIEIEELLVQRARREGFLSIEDIQKVFAEYKGEA